MCLAFNNKLLHRMKPCLQAAAAELSLDAQRAHITTVLQSTPPSSRRRERTVPTAKPTVKQTVQQKANTAAASSSSSASEEITAAVAVVAAAAAADVADVDSKPQQLLCVVCTVQEAALWCPECKSTYCMM
jgi:hypothetical protein